MERREAGCSEDSLDLSRKEGCRETAKIRCFFSRPSIIMGKYSNYWKMLLALE